MCVCVCVCVFVQDAHRLLSVLNDFEQVKQYGPDTIHVPNAVRTMGVDVDALEAKFQAQVFLSRDLAETKYRGNPLAREKLYYFRGDANKKPIYRFPGFQWSSVQHYEPLNTFSELEALVDKLEAAFEYSKDGTPYFHHFILTSYSRPEDHISYHQDSMHDIEAGTDIIIISFGGTRPLQLVSAASEQKPEKPEIQIPMQAGDIIVLGPVTNEKMKHQVPADPNGNPRWSLVMRRIKQASHFSLAEIEKRVAQAQMAQKARVRSAEPTAVDASSSTMVSRHVLGARMISIVILNLACTRI